MKKTFCIQQHNTIKIWNDNVGGYLTSLKYHCVLWKWCDGLLYCKFILKLIMLPLIGEESYDWFVNIWHSLGWVRFSKKVPTGLAKDPPNKIMKFQEHVERFHNVLNHLACNFDATNIPGAFKQIPDSLWMVSNELRQATQTNMFFVCFPQTFFFVPKGGHVEGHLSSWRISTIT